MTPRYPMPQSSYATSFRSPANPSGEAATAESLFDSHQYIVESIARRIRASLPDFASIEHTDLIQSGNMGLVYAIRSYTPESGVPFELFARFRIRGEMLDALRRLDTASRSLRGWQRKIRRITADLSTHLKREPTEEEISGHLGLQLDYYRKKSLDIRTASAVSRSGQSSERLEEASRETPGPYETRPDSLQSDRERKHLITYAINQLPDRHRRVILMYYQQEYTMRQIGEILCLDESRISQIHKGALRAMAENLRLSGIKSSADL
jgi:RNA polymerase sigma factor for flagellar operon FliA